MIVKVCRGMFNGFFTLVSPVLNWVFEKTDGWGWSSGFIECDSPRQLKWDRWKEGGTYYLNWGYCELMFTPRSFFRQRNKHDAATRAEQRINRARIKAELRMQRQANRLAGI